MSSQNFVFPPPPPPPPQSSSQSYPTGPQPSYQYGHGFQGSNEYGSRGRGRGSSFRGSRGGSNHNGQRQMNNGYSAGSNYGRQWSDSGGGSHSLPSYGGPQQQQQYPLQNQGGYGNGTTSSNNRGNQGKGMSAPRKNSLAAMGPPIRSGFGNYAVQSPAIPPPDHPQNNSYQVHNPNVNGHQHQQGSYGNQRQPYNRPNGNFPGHRGQKRPHGDAFEQSGSRKPQIMAPPAVPSFGSPLAIHPQQSVVETEKTPKKKRKYNQLGLTPQGEEHESSEEEEEIDEESKLAAAHGVGSNQSQLLKFSYKGRTSTLKSPSDIAAWIAERKKNYPTRARTEEAAERKRKAQEEAHLAQQQRKEEFQKKREEAQARKREAEKKKHAQNKPSKSLSKEVKAELKAEKLRKLFEKAQKKVVELKAKNAAKNEESQVVDGGSSLETKLEDSARKCGVRVENIQGESESSKDSISLHPWPDPELHLAVGHDNGAQIKSASDEAMQQVEPVVGPLTPRSQSPPLSLKPEVAKSMEESSLFQAALELGLLLPSEIPETSSLASSYDEDTSAESSNIISDTSSEGLTSSDDDIVSSDFSSSNSAPEEDTSKAVIPELRAPAKPAKKKAICRVFLAKGRCGRGEECQYRHELPERGQGTANAARKEKMKGKRQDRGEKVERMTLYQRMVAQEKEKEDELILQHIIFLGENKALD